MTINSWGSADPAEVAKGGSGRASHTVYAVICGGTTTTAEQQSIASVGTSGQVLTSNGAGALPTFQDASGGAGGFGDVLDSQTASDDTSIIIDNTVITSTYDIYCIHLYDFFPASDGDLEILYSTNNGSSFLTSNYRWATYVYNDAGNTQKTSSDSDSSLKLHSDTDGQESSGTIPLVMEIWIYNPLNSATATVLKNTNAFINSSGTPDFGTGHGAGTHATAAAHNAFKIQYDSGNIASGTMVTYGIVTS